MVKESFKKLSDYFLDIIECESSVHILPDTLKSFIKENYKNFECMKTEFSSCYYEVELYITTIFNKFINEKIADKNYSLFNISKDSLYDVLLLMKNETQSTIALEQQIKEVEIIETIPFVIENEIRIIIDIFSQKLETFKQSILYVQRSLEEKNIANSKDIEECKKAVEDCKKSIESTKASSEKIHNSFTRQLSNSKKQFQNQIKRSERKVHETSITVLGIFSAIVLTFNTIIGLFASTMQSLANSNTYKFILILLLIGLMTANILFGLFYFLKYVYKGKQAESTEDAFTNNHKTNKFIDTISETIKFAFPMIITNVIIIGMIVVLLCKWNEGCIETRNKKFYQQDKQIAASSTALEENQNVDESNESSIIAPDTSMKY